MFYKCNLKFFSHASFYDFLIDNKWDGIMVCDDVNIGPHGAMIDFWESIKQLKYDLTGTTYAHYTGTGIVCFDNQKVIY